MENEDDFERNQAVQMLLELTRDKIGRGDTQNAFSALLHAIRLTKGEDAIKGIIENAKKKLELEFIAKQIQHQNLEEALERIETLCLQNSLLLEQGNNEIIRDAFKDGSSVICSLCNGLISKERYIDHSKFWCPTLSTEMEEEEEEVCQKTPPSPLLKSSGADSFPSITTQLKFLALGDSLTAGYHQWGHAFHPYTINLKKQLEIYVSSLSESSRSIVSTAPHQPYLRKLEITNSGVSGETITEIHSRFLNAFRFEPFRMFEIICVLAGTNDLGEEPPRDPSISFSSMSASTSSMPMPTWDEMIFERLHSLYESVFKKCTVAMICVTIPQSGILDEHYTATRSRINQRIRAYVSKMNADRMNPLADRHTSRVLLYDLELAIPYFQEAHELQSRASSTHGFGRAGPRKTPMWDDTLHMTPIGYDFFGRGIFECVSECFSKNM